jgi:hypothetical protein
MSMVQCANGHFFNPNQGACPHCSIDKEPARTVGLKGVAHGKKLSTSELKQSSSIDKPFPLPNKYGQVNPAPLNQKNTAVPGKNGQNSVGKTVGMYHQNEGFDPVVGWLVCTEGIDRGKDYSLHSDKNSIGRLQHNDIAILGDPSISRENHATIVFDTKKKQFRILAGEGRGIVYLNNEAVDFSHVLKDKDTIEIGKTKLLFIPLCGEKFSWE